MGCSHACGAPKPTPEDDPVDRDAAPHALEARSRCTTQATLALPNIAGENFELGRAVVTGARVIIGARRGSREGVLDTDGLSARFTETSVAIGDAPPPLPIAIAERTIVVAYEGPKRHLVVRDVASPAAAIAELPLDPADESLAFDAVNKGDAIAIAWDAPTEDGSAIFATLVRNGKPGDAVRLSPPGVDAETPRLIALGPTLIATWIARRALPKSDAAAPIEGAGEDLDHAWIEMLAFDDTLHATSPLRHLTSDSGRVVWFDAIARGGPQFDIIARDAIELQAGQGGSVLFVRVNGPDPAPPTVIGGIGRSNDAPLLVNGVFLFDDAANRGRAADTDGGASPEPSLDGSRALGVLASGDILVAPETAHELHVVRCAF